MSDVRAKNLLLGKICKLCYNYSFDQKKCYLIMEKPCHKKENQTCKMFEGWSMQDHSTSLTQDEVTRVLYDLPIGWEQFDRKRLSKE